MFRPALDVNNESGKHCLVRVLKAISSLNDADMFINSRIRSDGMFNCYLGEEITINDGTYNAVWQVVGVDTELGKGGTPLIRHHITLVPETSITTGAIHNYNIDCNGYANSDMHNIILPNIVKHLESVLGYHLLTRRVKLTNATASNTSPHTYMASANGYYNVKANLLCQQQVYGTVNDSYGNVYDTGDDTEQLPGFKTGKVDKGVNDWYWLRDVYGCYSKYNLYYFSNVNPDGSLDSYAVGNSTGGIRPLITIG